METKTDTVIYFFAPYEESYIRGESKTYAGADGFRFPRVQILEPPSTVPKNLRPAFEICKES